MNFKNLRFLALIIFIVKVQTHSNQDYLDYYKQDNAQQNHHNKHH